MNAAAELPVHRSVPPIMQPGSWRAIPVDPCVLERLFFAAASGRPSDTRSRHNARNSAFSRWDGSGWKCALFRITWADTGGEGDGEDDRSAPETVRFKAKDEKYSLWHK
ncbi:hypothetical protein TWF506_010115 [Arthrobotrys conoides]|uniref:Uncharacterized protein n=1 Tax=Arthrobotrys conoides TaxID=74498 RepID=A0AAN8RWW7_9PEZI